MYIYNILILIRISQPISQDISITNALNPGLSFAEFVASAP